MEVPRAIPVMGLEVSAEVRLGDALVALFWPLTRRALVLGLGLAGLGLGAWFGLPLVGWLLGACVVVVTATWGAAGWMAFRDFRSAGGRPCRLTFYVCAGGVEVRSDARHTEWLTWEDLKAVHETPSSFLILPSGREQYILPKRCCSIEQQRQLRGAFGLRS